MREFGHQGNAHLRGTKADIWEGGHRVPFVVRWPGVVEPGSRCAAPVSSVDWYSTLLEMAGIEHNPDQIDDGESFVQLLNGEQTDRDRPITNENFTQPCHRSCFSAKNAIMSEEEWLINKTV